MTRNQIILCASVGAILVAASAAGLLWPKSGDPTSSEAAQRTDAARALAGRSDEAAIEQLSQLANDSEPRVARAAVRAMARAKEPANQQAISRIVSEAKNPAARGEAAAALAEFESVPTGRLTSLLAISGKNNAQVRAGAAKGLAKRCDRNAIWPLFKLLSDPDEYVRFWAITAISKTTCQRYEYNAKRAPENQREKIAAIGRKLKERLPK